MHRGAWRATVHGVIKSRIQLSDQGQHELYTIILSHKIVYNIYIYIYKVYCITFPTSHLVLYIINYVLYYDIK